jgi:hypothetical protein
VVQSHYAKEIILNPKFWKEMDKEANPEKNSIFNSKQKKSIETAL